MWGTDKTSAAHLFVLFLLGKSNLLEKGHLSRPECQRHRPKERAEPLLMSFAARAVHGQTGFLKMPLPSPRHPPDHGLFKGGDNSFDFYFLTTRRRTVLALTASGPGTFLHDKKILAQVLPCAFLRISGVWNTEDFQ